MLNRNYDALHENNGGVEPLPNNQHTVALPQQIDQRWVSVDVSNIIPEGRTRNMRRDYAVYR